MTLAAVLKLINSTENNKIKVVNESRFYRDMLLPQHLIFIHTGLTFCTKNGKKFDLLYDWIGKQTIKQPYEKNNEKRFLGRLYIPDTFGSYIAETGSFIKFIDLDSETLDHNKIPLEIEQNETFTISIREDDKEASIEFPQKTYNLKVFYDANSKKYSRFISDEEYLMEEQYMQDRIDEQELEMQQIDDDRSKAAQDEVDSWDDEGFWQAGREGDD